MDATVALLAAVIVASTPLLYAAVGELVAERSGVLNLGVEGMMLAGAVTGFAVTLTTGSHLIGIAAAAIAGAGMALVFAVLTLSLMANQVATGLALTIFGVGLSALVGSELRRHARGGAARARHPRHQRPADHRPALPQP